MVQRTDLRVPKLAWVVPLCLGLAACAQTYPRVIVRAPEARTPEPVASVTYAPPSVAPVYAHEPAPPVLPVYAPDPAPPRMVIAAADEAGPQPNPNPDPVPAALPKAPLAAYTPQASPLLAYDSAPHGVAPPSQPELLPSQTVVVAPRVSTYYGPYYRSHVWVGAPYYRVRPYYGYRPYPYYGGGPRFGLGWYGGHGPRVHDHYVPRPHYGAFHPSYGHHGYGYHGGHGHGGHSSHGGSSHHHAGHGRR